MLGAADSTNLQIVDETKNFTPGSSTTNEITPTPSDNYSRPQHSALNVLHSFNSSGSQHNSYYHSAINPRQLLVPQSMHNGHNQHSPTVLIRSVM